LGRGPKPSVRNRNVRRLALALTVVVLVAISRGLDTAFAVTLSLAVMEVDLRCLS
jgi:hypothetical protein